MPRTPQFASTPRFLLSQRVPPPSSSLSATRPPRPSPIDEDDSPQNTPLAKRTRGRPVAATPASATRQTGTQRIAVRDVIEDSEDESGLSGGEVDEELEAEYEAIFGESERSMVKRRRVEGEEREDEQNNDDADNHNHDGQTDGNANSNGSGNDEPEDEHKDNHQNQHEDPYADENIPSSPLKPPSTPFPNPLRPRFLLSTSSQLHTPSQTHSQLYPPSSTKQQNQTDTNPPQSTLPDPTTAPPSTSTASTRRKPGFVLPRSPSPDTALDDLPSLFSPSRTQRRRGRQRGSGLGYVAGGMAEQVRGWVLEMGVKGGSHSGYGVGGLVGERYAFVVRVERVERSVMGSCGELVFVRGVDVKGLGEEEEGQDDGEEARRNVLLMGAPQSRSLNPEAGERGEIPDLKTGDLVGVGWGLVWDVELDAVGESTSGEMEKWSVCMEWDVL